MILSRDFAAMLRDEPNCFTFTIENTTMLCKGHPKWDPKTPGKNIEVRALQIDNHGSPRKKCHPRTAFVEPLEAIEKWDDYHENKRKAKKRKMVEIWDDTIRPEL